MARKPVPVPPPLTEDLLSDVQIMQRLGVKRTKLHVLMRREGFPYIKLGRSLRFDPYQVAKWLDEHGQSA